MVIVKVKATRWSLGLSKLSTSIIVSFSGSCRSVMEGSLELIKLLDFELTCCGLTSQFEVSMPSVTDPKNGTGTGILKYEMSL